MRIEPSTCAACEKGTKRGVPWERITDYEPEHWEDITKLKLTDLAKMCRSHGFQFRDNSGKSKEQRRERLISTLQSHLRGIHGWKI